MMRISRRQLGPFGHGGGAVQADDFQILPALCRHASAYAALEA
jgi:hypothetical protein